MQQPVLLVLVSGQRHAEVSRDRQPGRSGVTATRYTLDGSTPTVTSPLYTTPLQFASTKTVNFRSWDTAGNVEAVKTATAQIDTVAPTISITSPAKREGHRQSTKPVNGPLQARSCQEPRYPS